MNKRIVLGITGGIAAYKAADLCSRLVRENITVQVIMTENARRFVSELTFRTLSRRPVVTSLWEVPEWRPEHVALASQCDLFAVVPATANFIAKLANGIADDALTTFGATFNGKTLLAPAMNPQMWMHPACRKNIETLRERGVLFAGPAEGRVACGDDGPGRMAEPAAILAEIPRILEQSIEWPRVRMVVEQPFFRHCCCRSAPGARPM